MVLKTINLKNIEANFSGSLDKLDFIKELLKPYDCVQTNDYGNVY